VIFVMTLSYFRANVNKSTPLFDDRARVFRCGLKDEPMHETRPPSSGCIVLPEMDLDRLSDDALAAVIAHELGHIERGHKSWQGAAEPMLIQWEADEAAIKRLHLAGYCAGETLRKAGKEIASAAYGPRGRHPWLGYPADCGPKDNKVPDIDDKALAFFNRGQSHYNQQEYDQAIQSYGEAIRLRPDYEAAFYGRASAYFSKKDYDRALADLDEALRLEPNFFAVFNDRGNAYSVKGDYARAIQDYDDAIRLKPDFTVAFYNRGRAYYGKRDYERALADLSRAIELDPNYAPAFNNRGLVYNAKRDYEPAIQDYSQAIRLSPKYTTAFNNRGNAYRSLRNYDLAIHDYNEAIRLNPNYSLAFNNRARAYGEKREYARALADYETATRIDPKSTRHRSIGATLLYLGRLEESAGAMERAVKAAPQDMYAMLWRYIALAKGNKTELASRELSENAVMLAKSRWPAPVIDYYLGRIDEKKMYAAAHEPDSKKATAQLCEANFYAGQAKLFKNDRSEAIPLLRAAEKDCPPTFYESHGASAELRRLGF
jgi:tetratricopeptide (TPR) repeat protein